MGDDGTQPIEATLPQPEAWRVVVGFVVAPAVPILLLVGLNWILAGFPDTRSLWPILPYFIVIGGYGPALVVGVPAYLVLSLLVRPTALYCAIAGAVVAAVPWLLVLAFIGPNSSFYAGQVMRDNGMPSVAGWISLLQVAGLLAVLGAIGGITFWAVVTLGRKGRSERRAT